MPSSNAVGMTIRSLRIKKALTFLSGASVSVEEGATLSVNGGVLRLVPQADAPADPVEGMVYADTDHKLYVHNGTTWVVIGSQS